MNRFYILLILIVCSCTNKLTAQNYVTVKQAESNYSVVLAADKARSSIRSINFYLLFRVNKNSTKYIRISDLMYFYRGCYDRNNTRGGLSGPMMFIVEGDSLSELNDNDRRKRLSQDTIKEFVFATLHTPKRDSTAQSLFKPYLQKMRELDKDTLHIGSIQQLKKTNPELLKNFLEGDSISLLFYKDRFYNVFLPIEIK